MNEEKETGCERKIKGRRAERGKEKEASERERGREEKDRGGSRGVGNRKQGERGHGRKEKRMRRETTGGKRDKAY